MTTKMSKVIQDESTNKYEPKETMFSLAPEQAISGITDYQTKAGISMYGYATEKLKKSYKIAIQEYFIYLYN